MRHAQDPAYCGLLNIVRKRPPTQPAMDAVFGSYSPDNSHFLAEADVAAACGTHGTVLCTHNEDVLAHNLAILEHLHGTVAVGARVSVTDNVCLPRGAANGAMGVVTDLKLGSDGHVDRILVRLDATGNTVTFSRSITRYRLLNGTRYFKSTFPLCLAYAITAHRAQVRQKAIVLAAPNAVTQHPSRLAAPNAVPLNIRSSPTMRLPPARVHTCRVPPWPRRPSSTSGMPSHRACCMS